MRSLTALLATCITLAAQDPANELSRTEAALAGLDPRFAYAVAIVPLEGEAKLHVAGRIDERTPFATWHLVPLGEATRFFLDVALARAIADGTLNLTDEVLRGDGAGAPGLQLGELSEFFAVEWPKLAAYERFAADAKGFRPVVEVVAAHAILLPRTPELPNARTLQVALAQHRLEQGSKRAWAEWLPIAARELGVRTAVDLTRTWPARSVAAGRREDGSAFPVRLAEVAAAGNAACAADDLVPLARNLLSAVLDDEASRRDGTRSASRFFERDDERFAIATRVFQSDWLGQTLAIELIPAERRAVVIFATRPRGDWFAPLRDTLLTVTLGREPQEQEPGLRYGGRFAKRPSLLSGTYRGQILVDGETLELEISAGSLLFGAIGPRARIRGGTFESARTDRHRICVALPLAPTRDEELVRSVHIDVAGDADDSRELSGAAWLERRTRDGILVELLPQRIVLRRAKDD
ncbi:MAG: hypothetical protein HZB39_16010 [Planctomycetes bacterium]|nr:hypothetical protein [Planctomycetota bacterium]